MTTAVSISKGPALVLSHSSGFGTGVTDGLIRVNAVSPGSIETPGLNDLVASIGAGDQRLKMLSNSVPLGRLGPTTAATSRELNCLWMAA